jgi:hypothetical protein
LAERYRRLLKTERVHNDISEVAFAVIKLQEWRYDAEYNPTDSFTFVDALFTSSMARQAITALERVPKEQLRVFVALLFFDVRS